MKKILLSMMAFSAIYSVNAQTIGHQWTKAYTNQSSGWPSEQVASCIGNSGHIISATNFQRWTDADPSASVTTTVSTPNNGIHYNGLITALDQNGNYQSHIQISSNSETKIVSITTDNDDHIFIIGYHSAPITIGTTTLNTSNVTGNYFLARLTYYVGSNFTSDWAYSFNKNFNDSRFFSLVVGDVSGTPMLFVGGESSSGLNLDIKNGGTPFNPGSVRHPLIIRYDINCNFSNYNYMIVGADNASSSGVRAMAIKNGNLYVTGGYGGTLALPSIGVSIPTKGATDVFTAKYTANNMQAVWAVRNGSVGNDEAVSIALDNAENAYITGMFGGTNFNFNPNNTVTGSATNSSYDIFVVKLTTSGVYAAGKWLYSTTDDIATSIAVAPNGESYLTGRTGSNGLSDGTYMSIGGVNDIFLMRFQSTVVSNALVPIFGKNIGTAHSSGNAFEKGTHLLLSGNDLYLSANTVRNTTNNNDVDFDLSQTGVADLSAYYANTSAGVATLSKYYTCTAVLTPSVTQNTSTIGLCSGNNYQFTLTNSTSFTSYTWQGPNGISSNTPTLNLTNPSSSYTSGLVTLQVNDANNCFAYYNQNLNFSGFVAPNTITAPSVACIGSSITFTSTGNNVNWYDNASSTVPVATGSVCTMNYTAAASPVYIYAASTNTNTGCENPRAIKTITIEASPATPVIDIINSSLSICEGQSTTIYSDNYDDWYLVPSGGSPTSSGTQFSTPTLTTNTTYYVEYKPGNCPSTRIPVTVTVSPIPTILSQTVQNLTCNGSANGSISLTLNNPGSYTYQWTPNVSTTFSATGLAAGSYTVVIGTGACVNTQTYNLTQPAAYTPTVNILGGNTLALAGIFTNTTFQWLNCSNGNAPIAGQTNAMFTPTVNGSYAVLVTIVGCPATSSCVPFSIGSSTCTINTSVSQNGNTLSSNQNGATYQWVDCNNSNTSISGATSQFFTPTVTGNYAVTITSGTCVATSVCTQINVTPVGISELIILNAITLHPNPASTYVTLNNVPDGTMVNIIDVTGKIVSTSSLIDNGDKSMTIHVNDLPGGVYFIQLKNNGAVVHKKLIISK